MKDETLKLALDDLIAEYHMETSSFAKRVDEIFKQALAAQPAVQPVWIQPDHLQKAQKAPFLCRVEPHKRDDFVPLHTTPPAAQPAPTAQEPVAYLFTNVQSGDIDASCDPDHKEDEREMWHREPLVRPPAQPAVQELVAWLYPEGLAALQVGKCWTAYPTMHDGCNIPIYTSPTAAVPDAITDNGESVEYRSGWNDCRQAMMEMMK
jgi:hypothetical protein